MDSALRGARRASAAFVDLTFHDLRGSAVTRLALAGCTVAGDRDLHRSFSLADVSAILDSTISAAIRRSAENAIRKLETERKRTKSANRLQTGPRCSDAKQPKSIDIIWWAHKDSNLGPAD